MGQTYLIGVKMSLIILIPNINLLFLSVYLGGMCCDLGVFHFGDLSDNQ